jgi:phage/plasmid-associated DNA primase
LVASNESWFIPAGPQSRRWLVLEVSGAKANNRSYFNAIHKQMESEGGLGGMLHDLLQRRITRDLKKAPETKALEEQREQYGYMDTNIAWWADQLATGVLKVTALDADMESNKSWPDEVSKIDLFNSYSEWCTSKGRRPTAPNRFFKYVLKFGFVKARFRRGNSRIYGYLVPSYKEALVRAKDHGLYLEEEDDHED